MEGKRIKLIKMTDDPRPIEPGSEGVVRLEDDMGHIHVDWDNGRTLALIPEVDEYVILDSERTMENIDTFEDFKKK